MTWSNFRIIYKSNVLKARAAKNKSLTFILDLFALIGVSQISVSFPFVFKRRYLINNVRNL